jgi:general secretion pathway protein C
MSRQAYKLAPLLIGLLVIVWVSSSLAQLTWILAGAPPRSHAASSRQVMLSPVAAPNVDISAILALAPFGAPVAANSAFSSTAAASGGFILEGVMLAGDPASSQAIIAAKGGKPKSYLPGETIGGGAVLISVQADHVTLLVAGRNEVLGFAPLLRPGADIAAMIGAQGAASTAPKQTPIDEVIVQARQRIAQNPKAVLDDLGVQAGQGGYLIGPNASAMTRRAGFRPGDLVTRVNGVAVGDIENDRRLFEDVVESGSARVEIVRDGSVTVLTFPLR